MNPGRRARWPNVNLRAAGQLARPLVVCTALAACAPESPPEPGLVLVTLDTVRADRIGCYGDRLAATPAIDALCAEGVKLGPAVTPVPLTLPAHATLLTGKEPPAHGVRGNGAFVLPGEHETLAEILERRGFDTGAFVGAFPLDRRFGLAQGFDMYDDKAVASPGGFHYVERRGSEVVDAALAWLAERGDRPFFIWVHLFDAHDPYTPPEPYTSRFATDPYRGEIAYADAQVGRLFEALKQAGRWKTTAVIVTADHGEALGEHGEDTHGFFVYEATVRVPLIIKGSDSISSATGGLGSKAALQAVLDKTGGDHVLRLADVMPLALWLLGAGGPPEPGREAYLETLAPQLDYNWAPLTAIRTREWKYINAPKPELYDLRTDPGETRNLFGGSPESVPDLAAQLTRIRTSFGRAATDRARSVPDRAAADALASLGYVAGTSLDIREPRDLRDPKDMLPLAKEIDAASRLDPEALVETVARLKALARRDPANNLIRRRLATACERLKDLACAAEAYEQAMALGYRTADIAEAAARAYVGAGLNAERRGDSRSAGRYFERAVAFAPADARALEARGTWLARAGRLQDAERALGEAASRAPDRWQPRYQLGLVALKQSKATDAVAELERARALAPGSPDILFALGEAYRRAARGSESAAAFREFLAVAPPDDPRRRIAGSAR